ncbi:MAG TPA: glutamate racemase [Syntrophomonadaceae bacterium]|nr:glutamate racemase [Syntrophomonadaceae bacterium]HRX21933.1 glutamate racemase [Syntrophomonadaceae bacterium]
MPKTDPIGIFDSGVGGLTVVKSLLDKMPQESFIYFGDTAHVPYGEKTREQLLTYAQDIMKFMMKKNCKAIVVACGTHSSVTLPLISNNYTLPLLGVLEVGARQAIASTRNGKIGVAATQATVDSRAFTKSIVSLNKNVEVMEVACPRLVPLVEAGKLTGPEAEAAIKSYFDPLLDWQADTVILGCTHYPFLVPSIKKYTEDSLVLIDTAGETVDELKALLESHELLNDSDSEPVRQFFVSGEELSFYNVGKLLIGDVIKHVDKVKLS